ncbi:hypothetical protein GFS24_26715 [Chitinophaga sp. SYP-B3965]|uniref:hypothetical protein n=1 Tax=Chitinophaga sp. SYP-B3965 TaxID=2663120 RepID=UPI001299AA01|nr:hypothetical protein [Chitinophaga sp. SYP-B3965]MRG48733.1 hypothetical protein [Chitinophaga sp. SYP-B3965]
MKKIFTILLALLVTGVSYGQYLTQDAAGKSSIPLPLKGLGIGIDIGKTEATFGLNNYERVFKEDKPWVLGINLSTKNVEGLSNLFTAGKFIPDAKMQGFIGFSVSNNKKLNNAFRNSEFFAASKYENNLQRELFEDLKAKTLRAAASYLIQIKDPTAAHKVMNDLKKQVALQQQPEDLNLLVENYSLPDVNLTPFLTPFKQKYASLQEEYLVAFNAALEDTEGLLDNTWEEFLKNAPNPTRYTFFLIGGINGRSFPYYKGLNTTELEDSFEDVLFKGGNLGLGVNVQVRNFWLGATYSYLSGDNFSSLSSREFNLKTVASSGSGSLTGEKKFTAYTGKYAKVETNELNIDLVGDFRITDSSRVIASLYSRSSLASRDTAYLKNYTNIGVGLYFTGLKGKFLGGLYLELPDVSNNAEKAKPLAERSIQSPFKRLTFGIVTKFNLSSIFDFSNKAVRE